MRRSNKSQIARPSFVPESPGTKESEAQPNGLETQRAICFILFPKPCVSVSLSLSPMLFALVFCLALLSSPFWSVLRLDDKDLFREKIERERGERGEGGLDSLDELV